MTYGTCASCSIVALFSELFIPLIAPGEVSWHRDEPHFTRESANALYIAVLRSDLDIFPNTLHQRYEVQERWCDDDL